ncbi:MAG: GNAT family N-acetyltransferase [Firmicutes bacterium]|nr:GNAT family N-acetyltransferase [Bacillota bacterium]
MEKSAFLTGENIYLRGLLESDARGNYQHWFNDSEVCRSNSHHRFPYNEKKALDYIEYSQRTRDALILAIVTRDKDEHIGNISLQDIDYFNRTADLAVLIGEKDCWGRGFSKEAALLIIDHGFSALGLNRITCGTTEDNLPMQRLALAMGFQREGVRRAAVFKNNRFLDVYEYGLLTSEWLDHKKS